MSDRRNATDTSISANEVGQLGAALWTQNAFVSALLVYVAFARVKLSDAVRFRVADLCFDFQKISILRLSRREQAARDKLFIENGGVSLDVLLERHLDNEGILRPSSVEEANPALALFPSRKGRRPITARTAERRLAAAIAKVQTPFHLDYRTIRTCGKSFAMQSNSKDEHLGHAEASDAVAKCRWFYRQILFYDKHEEEDASQEAALAILQKASQDGITSEEATRLAYRAGRDHRSRVLDYRERYATNRINDWSVLYDPYNRSPIYRAHSESLRLAIEEAVKELSYREREVIKLRFGLQDGYRYTQVEIGHIFKISAQRVHQIEESAMEHLRDPSIASRLAGFDS